MDINGLSNYSGYMNRINEASKVSDKLGAINDASDEELMDACKDFESYFMGKIFTTMLESTKAFTGEKDDGYASKMVDYFKDTAIQAITEKSAEAGGIGLAKQLYEQMKKQNSWIKPETLRDVVE